MRYCGEKEPHPSPLQERGSNSTIPFNFKERKAVYFALSFKVLSFGEDLGEAALGYFGLKFIFVKIFTFNNENFSFYFN
jgi:hypothetical protein